MKTLLLSSLLFMAMSANATKYYMSKDGKIRRISAKKFDRCTKIYYRKKGKTGLSAKHKKGVVKATLKGELVNDATVVATKMKGRNGSCTHAGDREQIR